MGKLIIRCDVSSETGHDSGLNNYARAYPVNSLNTFALFGS